MAALVTSLALAPTASAQSKPTLYVGPSPAQPGGTVTAAVSDCIAVFGVVKSPGFEGGEIKISGGTNPYGSGHVVKKPGKYTAEVYCRVGGTLTVDFTVAEKPTTTPTPPPPVTTSPPTKKPAPTTTKPAPPQVKVKPRGAPETGDGTLSF
jgi:hypothetical protein